MNNGKAIGGYFELDASQGRTALPDGVLLNSGRNALRHIVRKLGVTRIHVPYYTCPVVWEALAMEKCQVEFYEIGMDLRPKKTFPKDEFVLYTNYFGCCGGIVDDLSNDYGKLIVDCAQAYYANPKGLASFSSPRKFFGVPDGGVAYGVFDSPCEDNYAVDEDSHKRMVHLELRRHGEIEKGYESFLMAESSFKDSEIKFMSPETRQMLGHVDKDKYAQIRMDNFQRLDAHLHTAINITRSGDDVPMVYPYMTDDPHLRTQLLQEKIYVASYWPGVRNCGSLRERILPLPIDQRYGKKQMDTIIGVILG